MELEDRNPKPSDSSQNLPMAVLITLVGIVCLLLYVGWQMISDEPSKVSDLDPTMVESKTEVELPEPETIAEEAEMPEIEMPKADTKPQEKPKKVTSITSGGTTITHTVTKGETFYGIANRYNLSSNTLETENPDVDSKKIKVGTTKLKIPVMANHTVGPGDILRVVSSKYDVSVDLIMKANGKTKNFAERGEKLIIPFAQKK
jgi:LysM repeat protein